MGPSLNLGRFFNIPIKIHWSFWLLVLWVAWEGFRRTGEWRGIIFAVIPLLLFFGCVMLHELGHAIVAQGLGVAVNGIVLWPFGGLAQVRNMPQEGSKELLIAIAGPAVNLFIALILGDIFLWVWGPALAEGFLKSPDTVLHGIMTTVFKGASAISLIAFLIITNLLLAVFNLIPAFPMDGGRILRGGLALVFSFNIATQIATLTGQFLAIAAVILTFTPYFGLQSPSIVFVSMFVLLGATYENKVVQKQWVLKALQVAHVNFATTVPPVFPQQNLKGIIKLFFASPQHDLPVIYEGKLVGMLRRDDLLQAVNLGQTHQMVNQVMRTDYPAVSLKDNLQTVKHYITSTHFTTLPIVDRGEFVGMINLQDVTNAYTKEK